MRLFTAIRFQGEVEDCLWSSVEFLQFRAEWGRFTLRENLHLTLNFLGETDRASDIKDAMNQIRVPAFSLVLGGLGIFRRPGGDVLWLGVKCNNELHQLYFQLAGILAEKGFQPENREYCPHLTMGREVIFPAGFSGENFNRNFPGIHSEVAEISLMKSERIAGRLTYSEFYRKALT